MADVSLTGIWQGLYTYPAFADHVAFTATILDLGGSIEGTTHEDNDWLAAAPSQLEAALSGRRADGVVRFTKTYATRHEAFYAPVDYEGRLDGEGNEIEGTWRIPGFGSGTFLMIRPERAPEQIEVRATERV